MLFTSAGSTNVTVNNVKAYSSKKWTDGIDTFNASNITINDIFMRTGDDAIAIYGSRANGGNVYSGLNSSHISVTNSILTPDTAHPINIGTHGDPTLPGGGDTIDTLSFSNLDIWSYHQALPISVARQRWQPDNRCYIHRYSDRRSRCRKNRGCHYV